MTAFETIIIAIVEGLTEFLPVSSTGHMIITQNLLGVESTPFVKAFTIIIQFGAILSVVCLYWNRFFRLNHTPAPYGSTPLQAFLHKWDFYWKLLVALMLVIGGVFMLFCDRIFNKGNERTELTEARAFRIGLFQCIAMIPGVSRSMATIVGGMAQKLTRRVAAEFSFFLAVPTMAAATALDVLQLFFGDEADASWATRDNLMMLALGCVVAFVVALLAMKWFVSFLTKYGFKAFGVYRIIVGIIILALLWTGHSLVMVD